MTTDMMIKIHAIAEDGLPDMAALTGRVAFIFDGSIVSGWPLDPEESAITYNGHGWNAKLEGVLWESNSDVGYTRPFGGVTHWVEFPVPLHEVRAR